MKKSLFLLIMFVGVMSLCTGCGEKKINVNDYLSYKLVGCEGYGTFDYTFDVDGLGYAVIEAAGMENPSVVAMEQLEEALGEAVNFSLDSTNGTLSNGDEVKLTWSVDKNALKEKYNVVFKYDDITEKVEGLKPVEEVDVFEGITITESGTNGEGIIQIYDEANAIDGLLFTPDKQTELSNGDVITIKVEAPMNMKLGEFFAEMGRAAKTTTFEYTVKTLKSYLSNVEELDEEKEEQLKSESKKVIEKEQKETMTKKEKLKKIEYVGSYTLRMKDGYIGGKKNMLYVINKVTVSNADEDTSFYHYCYYSDVMLTPDNKLEIDYEAVAVPTGSASALLGDWGDIVRSSKGNFVYKGFSSLEELKESKISQYEDSYTITTNIK